MNSEATSSGAPGTPAPTRAITVLLVDDQRIIGEVVRRMFLDQPDIAFHYCADATEALHRAQDLKPDVILQDLVMPGIDGIELVRQYRAQEVTKSTPVIVLSASEDVETRRRASAAGANEFMVKPPPKASLLEQIRGFAGVA
jgi:PleD family two-component response regulator